MAKDQIEVEIFIDDRKADAVLRQNKTKFDSFVKGTEISVTAAQFANMAKLNAYRDRLLETQQLGASKTAEMQQQLKGGADALLRSVGLSGQLSDGLTEAASKAAVLRAESQVGTAAMAQMSASTVLINSGIAALAVGLAAGVVSILAAKKLSEDIRKEAERRLAVEMAITAEYNKQSQAIGALKPRLAEEAGDRAFGRFVQSDDIAGLQMARDRLTRERNAAVAVVEAERADRERMMQADPSSRDFYKGRPLNSQAELDSLKQLDDQISKITARIDEIRNIPIFDYHEVQARQVEAAQKAADERYKIEVELAKRQDAFNLDSVKSLTELKKFHFKSVAQNALEAFDQEVSIAKRREDLVKKAIADAKEWANAVKKAQKDIADAQKQVTADFASTINNRISAVNLRDEARQFRAGTGDDALAKQRADAWIRRFSGPQNALKAMYEKRLSDENTLMLQERVQAGIEAVGGRARYDAPWFDQSGRLIQQKIDALDAERSAARDRAIIGITSGIDPERLTSGQRDIAAAARLREADRLDKEKTEGIDALKEAVAELKKLNASGGLQMRIVNEAEDRARVTQNASPANVNNRYGPPLNTSRL